MHWLRIHWHWPFCVVCLTTAALMVSYMLWAQIDIPDKITSVAGVNVGVVRLPCSEAHFWGNVVYYNLPGGTKDQFTWGRVCRDWFGQRWVLVTAE